MKTLIDCHKTCKVKIIKLHAKSDLKQRLIAFGIMRGTIIEVMEHAPAKSTIKIKVGKMSIALRAKEAGLIDIEEIH